MNTPAFPTTDLMDWDGLTKREYAAIKLRVPNSGLDWLNDMIRQSLKNEWAGMALDGIISCSKSITIDGKELSAHIGAIKIADLMLTASEAERGENDDK